MNRGITGITHVVDRLFHSTEGINKLSNRPLPHPRVAVDDDPPTLRRLEHRRGGEEPRRRARVVQVQRHHFAWLDLPPPPHSLHPDRRVPTRLAVRFDLGRHLDLRPKLPQRAQHHLRIVGIGERTGQHTLTLSQRRQQQSPVRQALAPGRPDSHIKRPRHRRHVHQRRQLVGGEVRDVLDGWGHSAFRKTATTSSTGITKSRLSPSNSTGTACLGLKSTLSYCLIG